MLMRFCPTTSRPVLIISVLALALYLVDARGVCAQSMAQSNPGSEPGASEPSKTLSESPAGAKKPDTSPASVAEKLELLEQMLERQGQRLNQLQQTIVEQQETIRLLASKLSLGETSNATPAVSVASGPGVPPVSGQNAPATISVDDRLKKLEGSVSDIGRVKFSGDIRLRSESFFGLSNILPNGDTPGVLGNELSARHRMRLRARLTMRGSIGSEFDWGLRLATGSFADSISTNQTLTDFYNRKPFALDQAYINYKPNAVPGLRLQGGKFEPPWAFTELTFDTDIMVEGISESYTRTFKKSKLKELSLVAWQSPILERNSAFVRNSNGTVNIEESRRGGRDLALYGGQVRSRFEFSPKTALSLSVADLYFSGTQFISPVQVFGSLLQLPLTFTIPASGSTPAQIITTQVLIPRDFLLAGNGNLGLTNASNNATNRDGRLASGYNLVDLLARVDLKHSKRWPVTVFLNLVTNTRTRDVVTVGPGGVDLVLPNHENNGFWGEIQVGQTRARGDMQFGYTFMRIEKDAVLTPFNMSDITQQSDMRGHRLIFSYAADPRVTFTVTGIVTQRPNGLLGPFVTTPPGSFNLSTKRLQLDTVIRF